ncbi:TIGR00730 family Rossman fold protein [Balneola sp. MJW-20]|uniref:LOG family protein n=1 Tax=Gracilimonas aurantiaca TaxID=3234185 RepID=UPI003465F98F
MKKICVYCGSRTPNNPVYGELAVELGQAVAERNWTIVYGGGRVGMMGKLADAALENDGEVIGVIPTALKRREVAHPDLTKMHETQDMHTRKALMESHSDAFVILPGGFGTLDEFFEILTWRQLGFHDKPIIMVNKEGYFDGLIQFSQQALSEDFIRPSSLQLFRETRSVNEVMELLDNLLSND